MTLGFTRAVEQDLAEGLRPDPSVVIDQTVIDLDDQSEEVYHC